MIVKGDYITSLIKYYESYIMICSRRTALIIDVATMKKMKLISINSEIKKGNHS